MNKHSYSIAAYHYLEVPAPPAYHKGSVHLASKSKSKYRGPKGLVRRRKPGHNSHETDVGGPQRSLEVKCAALPGTEGSTASTKKKWKDG